MRRRNVAGGSGAAAVRRPGCMEAGRRPAPLVVFRRFVLPCPGRRGRGQDAIERTAQPWLVAGALLQGADGGVEPEASVQHSWVSDEWRGEEIQTPRRRPPDCLAPPGS